MKNVSIEKVKAKKQNALAYSDEYQRSRGALIDLSEEQRKKLGKKISKEIENWKTDSAELHKTLQDWNDILEGVIEETDYPYEGAPNLHIDLIGICMKIYHTIASRSILGQREVWYGISAADSDVADMWTDKVEEMVNLKTEFDWNLKEQMRDAIYCGARDGLSGLKIPYAEDYERVKEVIYVESVEQLLEEFSGDMAESGLEEEELQELMLRVQNEASPESPVEILIEYDKPVYIGPKAYLVERVNLVTFPANAKSLEKEDCRGYGDRYWLRKGEVEGRGQEGAWYKDAVEKLLKKNKYDEASDYDRSRDEIIGLGDEGAKDKIEFFDLVYLYDLDGDGKEEKYLLTFSYENKRLMAVMEYPYRVNYFAIFRREKRPGQLDGRSIVGELEYVNDEIDHRHNSRTMSMDITNIPSFKAKKSAIKDFDPEAEENRWRPGVTFWLEDPEAFEQFRVQPVDYGQSLAEESNLMKLGSLIVGFDIYTFSGHAMSEDPDAPGNKTAMLIEQGNLRMQNVLEELRFGVDQVGAIVLSHLYQFGPAQLSYKTITDEGRTETVLIPKRVLRSLTLRMRSPNVIMNADDELKRLMFARNLMLSEPTIAADTNKRVSLLKKIVSKANIYGMDKLLPSQNDIQMFEMKQALAMRAQSGGGGANGSPPEDPGMARMNNAVERAKAASEMESLQTKKVKNASEKVRALADMKEAMVGGNGKKKN